jgi:hypothetical protein
MPEYEPRDLVAVSRPPTENPKPGKESTNADGIGRYPAMCQRIGQQRQQLPILESARRPGSRSVARDAHGENA